MIPESPNTNQWVRPENQQGKGRWALPPSTPPLVKLTSLRRRAVTNLRNSVHQSTNAIPPYRTTMAAASSSSLRIPTPTHHPAAGARPRRLPFHAVSVRPRRSAVAASSSPLQGPAPGDGDDNGPAAAPVPVPVPFSRDAAIALPRKADSMFVFCLALAALLQV